ncbi:DUF4129 domain-containing protein [Rubrivirga litoralis]|uniref:DUF4129 domain-containing protein n=1 Tax=Rubrivirga litoralis TaxID=3075598 RepID=A0ABU3BMA1_9BACT|nr:DUF4129 domain-containing protein [Rubrivirga sp. F394]MDT0630413.1 DUF4129 domain-containing protein [Rubrivirga sp. F394]
MRAAVVLVALLLAGGAGRAQEAGPPPPPAEAAPPELHTARVRPRAVPDSLLGALAADPAFQYDRPVAEQPSLWDRFWRWFAETFLSPALDGLVSRPVAALLMALAALAAVWVVLRLVRGEGSRVFGRRDLAPGASDPLLDVDDLQGVDLAGRLRQALAGGDHRAAVRLRYLLALQEMEDAGLVVWSREKTNRTYVAEARRADAAVGGAFAEATRVFDWVWYGGLAVDADRYGRFEARFDRLDAALGRPARPAGRTAAPPPAEAPPAEAAS